MEEENSGLLNLRWQTLWRLAVGSWLAFFCVSWASVILIWSSPTKQTGYWLMGAALALAFATTLIPGLVALIRRTIRERLLFMPTAAALAAITFSFIVSVVILALVSLIVNGSEAFIDSTAVGKQFPTLPMLCAYLFIGIVAFPTTFGLGFPLAIPLVCTVIIRTKIHSGGQISLSAWVTTVVISVLGWIGVVLAGMFLGLGG